jgi:hypothetical protein
MPLTISQRGVRLQEHLTSIRLRRGVTKKDSTGTTTTTASWREDVATQVLDFCTSDDYTHATTVTEGLRTQQQCAVVRVLTLSHLERLFTTSRKYHRKDHRKDRKDHRQDHRKDQDLFGPLILPVVEGLRSVWRHGWEMVLPACGFVLESKLGNAWTKLFEILNKSVRDWLVGWLVGVSCVSVFVSVSVLVFVSVFVSVSVSAFNCL